MATLHVRGVPEDIYEKLRAHADQHDMSISAAAIFLLSNALAREGDDQAALIEEILANPLPWPDEAPSPAELIREARDG